MQHLSAEDNFTIGEGWTNISNATNALLRYTTIISPLLLSRVSPRVTTSVSVDTGGGEEEVITRPPEQHSDRISPHDLHFSKQINIFTGFSKWFNHDLGYLPPTRPPSHTHNPDVLKITKCPYCITLCLSNKDYRFCLYN